MAVDHQRDDAAADDLERLWASRLRWRLRGAWQWPTFVAMTAADAVLLAVLPFSGGEGERVMAALLLAGFLNLGIVALGAPLAGVLVRRRRPELPRAVAADRAGTALLVGVAALLLAGGLANRSAVSAENGDRARALAASDRWFAHNAPALYGVARGHESVWHPGPDVFRACLPTGEAGRDLCVYVDTSGPVATVTRDHDEQPNSVIAGPDNPGRLAR